MCIPQEGRPFCKCPPGLSPDPSPEIRCSVLNPCQPSPCGPGTSCTPNSAGNPICRCLPGLIPQPDTITGCGPECVVDPDCHQAQVCRNQRCVERPDPCQPSPCGPGTTCQPSSQGNPICRCLPGLIPKPDTITGQTRIDILVQSSSAFLLIAPAAKPSILIFKFILIFWHINQKWRGN